MLDLFGSKRRAILNSEQFQKNIAHVKDLYNLILKMSDADTACKIFITCDDNSSIVSFLTLTFTTQVKNSSLRLLLNEYYENFSLKKFFNSQYNQSLSSSTAYPAEAPEHILHSVDTAMDTARKATDIARHNALDKIGHTLFRDEASFSLYESCKKRYGIDIDELLYDGFGIPKNYAPSKDNYVPFSFTFSMETGLLNKYRGGGMKSPATIQDERKFYTQILLDELNKI